MLLPLADLHCDTALALAAGRPLEDPARQVNLPAMRAAGVGLQVFAAWLPPSVPRGRRLAYVTRLLDGVRRAVDLHPEALQLCVTGEDLAAARATGRIAVVLAVENGDVLEDDLANVARLRALGVRLLTLVHARSNAWIASSVERDPAGSGLTEFGADVVRVLEDAGVVVDVSHAHDRAVERVLAVARRPVVASHSCARALCDLPRNLPDDLVRGIAATGGVVGVNLFPFFLDPAHRDAVLADAAALAAYDRAAEAAEDDLDAQFTAFEALRDAYGPFMAQVPVPLARAVAHVRHLLAVGGEGAVALGGDLDGMPALPDDAPDCRVLGRLRDALVADGLPAETVARVCWENAVRVLG